MLRKPKSSRLPPKRAARTDPLSGGLERLFELSPALLCIAGMDGYFKRVNPAFHSALGHTEADLLAQPFIEFVHPDDREATLNEVGKLSTGIPAVHFENRYRHADGSYRWLLWNTTPVAEEGLLYATALDITQRKQRQRELQETQDLVVENEGRLQALAARLVVAEEGERRRIARGLHDDVGQTLLAAKLSLGELLDQDAPGERDSSAQELQRLLDRAIQTTRNLTFDLASEALYEVGLGAALQSECERAEQLSGIRFHPPDAIGGNPIPEAMRVILFRAGRELIHNVVKHSGARTAKISLSLDGSLIRLTVEDDGRGFDVARRDPRTGFGLFSIGQQLHPIGGKLEIVSSPESGTRAVATVPFDAEGEGA